MLPEKDFDLQSTENVKFLLIAGFADSLLNFRGSLIEKLQSLGLQVHVAAPAFPKTNAVRRTLEARGVIVHEISVHRTSKNPINELASFFSLWRLMRSVQPKFVLSYTVKPVIYGSTAAWLCGVPKRFALITGLGYVFQRRGQRGILLLVVQWLYTLALKHVHIVFFHNVDDEALFRRRSLVNIRARACVINGSGVDIAEFNVVPLPLGPPCFLCIARLLGDKGVREYAEAARRIRTIYSGVRFLLVGWIDSNPDAIRQYELDAWVADGTLDFLGRLDDVRPAIALSSVYVLPSYGEGTPRTVLEAMAMGRAVITTDAPGCRETVVQGDNGLLVPVKSVEALEQAMLKFVEDKSLSLRMGKRSRQIAEAKYDVYKVNAVMLKEMGIE